MSKPELFAIWEEPTPLKLSLPWRVQLIGHIGQFPTEIAAQRYVDAVIAEREKAGIKIK